MRRAQPGRLWRVETSDQTKSASGANGIKSARRSIAFEPVSKFGFIQFAGGKGKNRQICVFLARSNLKPIHIEKRK